MIALFLLGGFALLLVGGEFLVRGSVGIALKLRVSKVVIGLTLVAFATSAPELLVSVVAATQGKSDIALGNVIGSNIANIGLILGVSLLLKNINPKGAVSLEQRICLLVVTLFFCSVLYFHPLIFQLIYIH